MANGTRWIWMYRRCLESGSLFHVVICPALPWYSDPAYIRTGIRPKKAKPIVFRMWIGYRLTCVCGSGSKKAKMTNKKIEEIGRRCWRFLIYVARKPLINAIFGIKPWIRIPGFCEYGSETQCLSFFECVRDLSTVQEVCASSWTSRINRIRRKFVKKLNRFLRPKARIWICLAWNVLIRPNPAQQHCFRRTTLHSLFTYVIADQAEVSIRRNKGEDPVRLPPLVPAQEHQTTHHILSISHIFYSQKLSLLL